MPERTSIFQRAQIGPETTPGVAVPATKFLQSLEIQPGVSGTVRQYRPVGYKYPTLASLGKEWVVADIGGAPSYGELQYILNSLLVDVAPTTIDTSARRWRYQPATSASDAVKTYTVEQGATDRAHRFTYGLFTELTLNAVRENIELSGSMIGRRIEDGVALTGTPAAVELVPIEGDQVSVFMDATQAGLGATKLSRLFRAQWKITDRHGPVWVLDAAQNSFVAHVEREPTVELVLRLAADSQGMGLLTNMRANEMRYIRFLAEGGLAGAATEKYSLKIDGAYRVKAQPKKFEDEDGVYAIEWTLGVQHDAAWGRAFEVDLVNKMTAL